MTTNTIDVVDSLSLLSLKVASNVFDLSSGLHHISIRDQMVRAQLAVRDLKRGDPELDSLLIVGAGVAGIAAALEAEARGVRSVVVVEAAAQPFSLLRGVTERYIGPFMYEWPSSFSCGSKSQTVLPFSTEPRLAITAEAASNDSTSVVLPAAPCPTRATARRLTVLF